MSANWLKPQVDLAALILRLGLAAIFIVHGYIKIVQIYPLFPEISLTVQLVVGWAELLCGLGLLVGLGSRLNALVLAFLQAGAIYLLTGKYALRGMLFKRSGADYTRVGPEYNMVLIAVCLGVILLGSGAISLDHYLLAWWRRKKAPPASQTVTTPSVKEGSPGEPTASLPT